LAGGAAPRVVIINETLAKKFFAKGDALNSLITIAIRDEIAGSFVGVNPEADAFLLETGEQ
jgi:hypothetical protein